MKNKDYMIWTYFKHIGEWSKNISKREELESDRPIVEPTDV